jgi:hypothetical protein
MPVVTVQKSRLRPGEAWPLGRAAIETALRTAIVDDAVALRFLSSTKFDQFVNFGTHTGRRVACASSTGKYLPAKQRGLSGTGGTEIVVYAVPESDKARAATLIERFFLPSVRNWLFDVYAARQSGSVELALESGSSSAIIRTSIGPEAQVTIDGEGAK